MADQVLPTEVASEYVEMLGKRLKVVVLSDGRRVFEDSDELRDIFALMGIEVVVESPV